MFPNRMLFRILGAGTSPQTSLARLNLRQREYCMDAIFIQPGFVVVIVSIHTLDLSAHILQVTLFQLHKCDYLLWKASILNQDVVKRSALYNPFKCHLYLYIHISPHLLSRHDIVMSSDLEIIYLSCRLYPHFAFLS